uniref:Uncharacterized protein n=1 Tax=Megaselia scalaris TaxID=36166 RepID=T1GSR7_MEGSC
MNPGSRTLILNLFPSIQPYKDPRISDLHRTLEWNSNYIYLVSLRYFRLWFDFVGRTHYLQQGCTSTFVYYMGTLFISLFVELISYELLDRFRLIDKVSPSGASILSCSFPIKSNEDDNDDLSP